MLRIACAGKRIVGLRAIITAALCLGFGASASAQMTSGETADPTQYGTFSGHYQAPSWGGVGAPSWGTYSGSVGEGGWMYNRTLRPAAPEGAIVLPNQIDSALTNPQTGAGLFTPQDSRLKGRDRP